MPGNVFDPVSSRYASDSTVQRSASELLLSFSAPEPSDDVLDVGCGTGALAARVRRMTEGRVVGADPSAGMIEAARRDAPPGIELVVSAAEELPFSSEFDLVLSNSALQWFHDVPRALARMRQALRPRRRLAIQAPATREYCPEFVAAMDEVAWDRRTATTFATFRSPWFFRETADGYADILERAGFSVSLARIDEVPVREPVDGAMRVFGTGAAAAYLGAACYPAPLPGGYAEALIDIVRGSLTRRADPDGIVELRFRRAFLVARAA